MTEIAERARVPEVAISIVVVNWNSGEELAACLESVERCPPSYAWEAIVVDNGSADNSVELGKKAAPWAVWIENRHNRGLAAANNQGLLAAKGDTIVLCNADIRFRPGTLDELVAALLRHERAAFVVPRVYFADGSLQTTAGNLPSIVEGLLGREYQRRKRSFGQPRGFCWDGWPHDEERRVGRAGDVCYAARRDAVANIGLLDERFPLDWEGVDWSARARESGWQIWFSPKAIVTHTAGGSTAKASRPRWIFETHRGMYLHFVKRAPSWARPMIFALFAIRGAAKLVAVQLGLPIQRWARKS